MTTETVRENYLLSTKELAAVLAALRWWQKSRARADFRGGMVAVLASEEEWDAILDIEGRYNEMLLCEIDELCERLNMGG